MKKVTLQDSASSPGKTSQFAAECWFDDACILTMDYFVKTLAGIKAKGVRPELIGSIIAHYSSKWLPELSGDNAYCERGSLTNIEESPESVTASWMKKRFFVETLVGVLPPEKDSIPCNFMLRLLRTANMVGVEPTYRAELEKRISWQLDQASLKELMIPSFSHTFGTLLDVELVTRFVKRFVKAAVDANLSLSEFDDLASALPSYARATDDGLYRAIDIYLKAHPGLTKRERKILCRLIDSRKLSPEASIHAAQNERLPVRAVIQVLFAEQTKLSRHVDWSESFNSNRSPNPSVLDHPGRCFSNREMNSQQMEISKLREDVLRLQGQCHAMQMQMERMVEKKKGFFRWKKLGIMSTLKSVSTATVEKIEEGDGEGEAGFERLTPVNMKTKLVKGRTPPKWRNSLF
ncbi:hypothetical protein GH714_000099 [Hevea brasiliensis]|uniref:NPH3 domain-containing protein n=1 Tax=Hevea brasiliensis TaxID=3981 RepID=A0A6A6LAW3_HEVBR|nr:hypothetical protein GH714_000099 [Hevea brasiliensis]